MIANASQVRFPCESPVPSRPVPSLFPCPSITTYVPATPVLRMDGGAPRRSNGGV